VLACAPPGALLQGLDAPPVCVISPASFPDRGLPALCCGLAGLSSHVVASLGVVWSCWFCWRPLGTSVVVLRMSACFECVFVCGGGGSDDANEDAYRRTGRRLVPFQHFYNDVASNNIELRDDFRRWLADRWVSVAPRPEAAACAQPLVPEVIVCARTRSRQPRFRLAALRIPQHGVHIGRGPPFPHPPPPSG
jgi:hypothetical protein